MGGGALRERPVILWLLAGIGAIALLIAFADRPVNGWIATRNGPFIDWLRIVTQMGSSRWYLVGLPVVVAVALRLRAGAEGHAALELDRIAGGAAFLFAAVALSSIATNILKLLIGRARPKMLDEAGIFGVTPFSSGYDFQSFPSGHATTLFALAAALGCLAPRWRGTLYALALLISLSSVAIGAHYPSDIVAGAMVGIATALLLRRFLARRGLLFAPSPQTLNAER